MRPHRIEPAAASGTPAGRGGLWLAAVAYTAFVIYGSLVPLEFQALAWDDAVARFREIRFLQLGIGSRADWVANLLLFIPLAFLWLGALAYRRSLPVRLVASAFVVACAVLLSVAIEFTQLYFPQRTVSLNDLFAESLGSLLGIALWWAVGERFAAWLAGWKRAQSHLDLARRITLAYLALLFGYSLLPLDLTISPVEVYHKFREGKLNLLPFARLPDHPVQAAYELGSDALLWLVPALLWRGSGKASSPKVWAGMTGAAVLLEILQLFVYSRVSDITDVFTAAVGAGLGVWIAGRFARQGRHATPAAGKGFAVLMLLAAAWSVLIFAVFWYPFEFRADGAFLRARLRDFLGNVPFQAYYFGTEYRAATEVMHKVLFFIPLGLLLGTFVSRLRYLWRGYGTAFSLAWIALIGVVAVGGRLAQPEKNPDIVDAALHGVGGGVGFVIARLVLSRRAAKVRPMRRDPRQDTASTRP